MCPPTWAHWRHLANTTERVLPSAHPSPQPKRQIDRFSRFCTAHVRNKVPILNSGLLFPPKLSLLMRDLDPNLIHYSLGQSKPIIQTASRSVQPFSHRWPQSVPYFTMGRASFPKISPSHMGSGPHLIRGSLGPPECSTQMASRSVQLFCRAHYTVSQCPNKNAQGLTSCDLVKT